MLENMYSKCKGNRALPISIMMILFVAVSTAQLTFMVASNGIIADNAYAKYTNRFEEAASFTNSCSGDQSHCIGNNVQTEGENNDPNTLISGPPGPEGPQEPPGPDQQLQVRRVNGDTVSVPAGSQRNADAFCDAGEVATGGGFDIIEGIFSEPPTNVRNPNIETLGFPDTQSTQWTIVILNPGPETVFIRAFAQCAKLVDAP
jgi:hypothetical protein